jgi:DNA-binding protein Fis
LIAAALGVTKGNQIKAAELIELNRNSLRRTVVNLDIRRADAVAKEAER